MRRLAPIAFVLAAAPVAAQDAPDPRYAFTGFGGVMLDDVWEDVFLQPWNLTVEKAGLAGVAASARVWRPTSWLDVEVESQLVFHFGDQRNVEVNAPIVTARWTAPPWARWIDSTVAYGIGVSWASERPALELQNNRSTEKVMQYWMIELDAALPADDWRLVGRLHHRSVAYGLWGAAGGSNALVLGLRRQF
ncbi:MAG: hypothetical protein EA355_09490 [Rhodobacteraceae bacterium]|nr:MAG: hypothetical protein EA355_09490 [Paracoccaceae bacterium]